MRELWSYTRGHRGRLASAVVATLLASALALAQPLAAQVVLDNLGAGRPLGAAVLVLSVLVVLSAAAAGVGALLIGVTGEAVVRAVRRGLAFRLPRLRTDELARYPPGTLISRATSDSTLLRAAATSGLVQLADGAFGLVTTFALMAYLDLRLAGVTVGVLVIIGAVVGVVLPRIRAAVQRAQESVGLLGAALDRTLGAALVVKANGAEARESARVDAATEQAYQAGLRGARYNALVAVVSEVSLQGSFLVVLGLGGAFVASGSLPVSTLVAFLLALFYLFAPIGSLTAAATELQQGLGAVARIREVGAIAIEDDVEPHGTPEGVSDGVRVDLDDVRFCYPDGTPALRGVSLTVPRRAVTALVGPSGAGKSTLFTLLLRFHDPDHGTITFDGTDLHTLPRAEVRRRVAWVDQDATLLAGTIAENLRLAAPETTEAEMLAALRAAHLHPLVDRLPDGLHSDVGIRGASLSGGERQRLAIARALLREPDLVLLDEATSALDEANERALRQTITELARTRTVLLIAHRPATVEIADTVLRIDDGLVAPVRS